RKMSKVINVEEELINQLSLDIPRKVLDKFQTLVRESSSEDEKEAFQFLGKLLDEVDIPYTLHHPKIYLSVPKFAKVYVNAPKSIEFRAKTPAFSFSTAGQKTEDTELVYVSAISNDIDIFDVKVSDEQKSYEGKIVISEGFAMPAR